MIKAKVTKNIIRKTNNSLGLTPKQILIAAIAFIIGILMYFLLRKYMSFTLLSTLIFTELATIICFGVVNIQGMSLLQFFIKMMKGPDIRYFESKGVYNDDIFKKEK